MTQLFTEHYMVRVPAAQHHRGVVVRRHGIQGPPGGAGVPDRASRPVEMDYLRWRDDGTPGGGHVRGLAEDAGRVHDARPLLRQRSFPGRGVQLLVPLRMHDEGLTAEKACEAVLRDNLFGLELDPRCTQIAAFALALAAWKYPDEDGDRSAIARFRR